jgi:hypothetical protein
MLLRFFFGGGLSFYTSLTLVDVSKECVKVCWSKERKRKLRHLYELLDTRRMSVGHQRILDTEHAQYQSCLCFIGLERL